MPVFTELAHKPLPLLPNTADQLHVLLGRAQTRTPDLQEVMLKDPAATITVFRHLHRLKPGSTADVADVAHAAAMIGFEEFKSLLKDLPTLAAADVSHLKVCQVHYGENAHAGHFAKVWAESRGLANPNAAASAALLQKPAALVLAAHDPESAARAAGAVRDGVPAETAYGAELGRDYRAANQYLATHWGYSTLASEAAAEQSRTGSPADLVALAADLARSTAADWQSEESLRLIAKLAPVLQLSENRAAAQLRRQAVDIARELHGWGFPTNAYGLLQTHRDDEVEPAEMERIERILRRTARPVTATPSNPLQAVLARALGKILQDSRVQRVVLALLSRDRTRLTARLTLGGDPDGPISRFDLAMKQRHLFALLMSKSQSLWVHAANRDKYRALFPKGLDEYLRENPFFAMSLVVDGRPVGMLYADGLELNEHDYAAFRRHCQNAVDELTRHRKAA